MPMVISETRPEGKGGPTAGFPRYSPSNPTPNRLLTLMNSSVRPKPSLINGNGEPNETRKEKLLRIQAQVSKGFYFRSEILLDVADALLMNPDAFENLNEKNP